MTTAINAIGWTPDMGSASSLNNASEVGDFARLLQNGAATLTGQTNQVSEMLTAYAVGESIAPHELVMAMEQAKLSLQMAVEVRNRLLEAYQELTRLQI